MYVIEDNAIIPIKTKNVISFGTVQDPRIVKVETVVANYFNVNVHHLNLFYKDTDAKVMCCFLLHDLFMYSIGSLGSRYNIDRFFLRHKITQKYIDCLKDNKVLSEVLQLREAYKNIQVEQQPQPIVTNS